jgi:hypothetical protein
MLVPAIFFFSSFFNLFFFVVVVVCQTVIADDPVFNILLRNLATVAMEEAQYISSGRSPFSSKKSGRKLTNKNAFDQDRVTCRHIIIMGWLRRSTRISHRQFDAMLMSSFIDNCGTQLMTNWEFPQRRQRQGQCDWIT